MNTQIPATGILEHADYGNAKYYHVTCKCLDETHYHSVWVEADNNDVYVTISTKVKSKFWQLSRWHKIWLLLTKGYVEYEESLILNKQGALNYANTLLKAIKDCEKYLKNNKKLTKGTD